MANNEKSRTIRVDVRFNKKEIKNLEDIMKEVSENKKATIIRDLTFCGVIICKELDIHPRAVSSKSIKRLFPKPKDE